MEPWKTEISFENIIIFRLQPFVLGMEHVNFEKNKKQVPALKLTAKAPETGLLEYKPFLLGPGLFSGANLLLVSGSRVNISQLQGLNILIMSFVPVLAKLAGNIDPAS